MALSIDLCIVSVYLSNHADCPVIFFYWPSKNSRFGLIKNKIHFVQSWRKSWRGTPQLFHLAIIEPSLSMFRRWHFNELRFASTIEQKGTGTVGKRGR